MGHALEIIVVPWKGDRASASVEEASVLFVRGVRLDGEEIVCTKLTLTTEIGGFIDAELDIPKEQRPDLSPDDYLWGTDAERLIIAPTRIRFLVESSVPA